MMTKKECMMTAIKNIINPFYLARNIETYKLCCKIAVEMIDDFKTECHLTDEVLRIMQTEIQCRDRLLPLEDRG